MYSLHDEKDRKQIALWLLIIASLIFLMIIVGGATRLTESGLSIVDWRPVTGVLPPLNQSEWLTEFEKYKQSPEYLLKNTGMSLEEFKGIFYWEWGHRLLGRVIGLAFFIPLVWFWLRGQIPQGFKSRLVFLLILGGGQGLLGWYMVQSGLVDEPAVSHYRLTAHLGLALFLFAVVLWTYFQLVGIRQVSVRNFSLRIGVRFILIVTIFQLFMGALVAGLKAGLIYNEWPMMGESLVPPGIWVIEPLWRNLIDNAVTVQFTHRITGYTLLLLSIFIYALSKGQNKRIRQGLAFVLLAIGLQVFVGVITLVNMVPVGWGTLHQAIGAVILAFVIKLNYQTRAH